MNCHTAHLEQELREARVRLEERDAQLEEANREIERLRHMMSLRDDLYSDLVKLCLEVLPESGHE